MKLDVEHKFNEEQKEELRETVTRSAIDLSKEIRELVRVLESTKRKVTVYSFIGVGVVGLVLGFIIGRLV